MNSMKPFANFTEQSKWDLEFLQHPNAYFGEDPTVNLALTKPETFMDQGVPRIPSGIGEAFSYGVKPEFSRVQQLRFTRAFQNTEPLSAREYLYANFLYTAEFRVMCTSHGEIDYSMDVESQRLRMHQVRYGQNPQFTSQGNQIMAGLMTCLDDLIDLPGMEMNHRGELAKFIGRLRKSYEEGSIQPRQWVST